MSTSTSPTSTPGARASSPADGGLPPAPVDLATRSLIARLARQARLKAVGFLAVVAVGTALLGLVSGGLSTRLTLGRGISGSLALSGPVWAFCLVASVVSVVSAVLAARCGPTPRERRRVTLLVLVSVVTGVLAVVAWAARGGQASLGGILALSVAASIPIVLGSTSGVLAERAGTFNIAIEGQLLVGAFSSALVATVTGSLWLGVLAGAAAGLLVGALLSVLTIRYRVPQVVAGFILVSVCTGLTGYLAEQVMVPNLGDYNSPGTLGTWSVPLLSEIPLLGPALFSQSPVFYLAVAAVVAVEVVLRRTRLGLRIRAVGENPEAAVSSGIQARRVRFWATTVAGGIGGLGGTYFTLGSAGQFVAGMSSGLGYVALAAVILGSWRASQAAAAALLFGFATSVSGVFGLLDVDIPPPFLLMAPYVITILVVAGVVAVGRGPAAAGESMN